MPVNTELSTQTYLRYAYCRDNGHEEFVDKANVCDAFFRGEQWSPQDLSTLNAQRRPALTINKILSTISTVMGEQIYNRAEIAFRPKSGAPAETADALTKVFKQVSDNNQLDWKRSDYFTDGIIASRGFLDIRIDFSDSMMGEVRIEKLNPKNVLIDPDADDYDPDTWSEVFVTKWVTADDIAVLYNREDADYLRAQTSSVFDAYGHDSLDFSRDRFGAPAIYGHAGTYDETNVLRNIRLIERQYRKLDRQLHFVDPRTGDMRQVPQGWERDRVALIRDQFDFRVVKKLVRRIRWTTCADSCVLHDEWSPYKHFTPVPYFPYFRHGRTIGLVENLLGPQELLNKVSSQELHVVNTTANSGWKVKTGSLMNMSIQELEQRGAETGLVVEVSGDPKDIEKLQPNQIPSGLDRISYKAEEHIKTISNVSDSMQGQDRADVAAKAIQQKRMAGSTTFVKPLDSLVRSDFVIARNVLDLVQEFYTEERLMTITKDKITGETETFKVNEISPEGAILNDLTLGEYGVTVASVPQRETLEDSQFEQAVSLRELGVAIPDAVLIDNSRLINKKDIMQQMNAQAESPEAKEQKELQKRGMTAEVAKTEAETQQKTADAHLKASKAQKEGVTATKDALTPPEPQGDDSQAQMELEQQKFEHQRSLDMMDFGLRRAEHEQEMQLAAQKAAFDMATKRAQAAKSQSPGGTP